MDVRRIHVDDDKLKPQGEIMRVFQIPSFLSVAQGDESITAKRQHYINIHLSQGSPVSSPLQGKALHYCHYWFDLISQARFFIFFFVFFFMASSTLSSDTSQKEVEAGQGFLQKHVAFFDRNKDGVVYPWETFQGFRAIGAGMLLSTFASLFINIGLSSKTRRGKWPSILFPIEVNNIPKAKHGSDTGVYDSEGRFVPSKFEEIFRKHAHTYPEALTYDELSAMLKANREPKDYGGWIAALSEWKIVFYLCKDKNGLLQKETLRGVYDGSLFERMEKDRQSAKKKA